MASFDVDRTLSDRQFRVMVAAVVPERKVSDAELTERGTDAVYYVTAETGEPPENAESGDGDEFVLKARRFVDPEAFRPEPHLLKAVARDTGVPVPRVVGIVDEHPDLPAPFFLMDRCEGETPDGDDLSPRARERLARDAGRYLGEVHAVGEFERFGRVRTDRDVNHDRAGIEVGGRRVTTEDGAHGSWRAWLSELVDRHLDDVDDRFADLEPKLRTFIEGRLDAVDRPFEPKLAHNDYRPGNLLLDVETGETLAVLDWGNALTTEARYDLVATEQYLCGWAPPDGPLRRRVRDELREGYAETNRLDGGGAVDRRRDLYLAATYLPALAWFSAWYADASEAEREGTAERHREFVEELVERGSR